MIPLRDLLNQYIDNQSLKEVINQELDLMPNWIIPRSVADEEIPNIEAIIREFNNDILFCYNIESLTSRLEKLSIDLRVIVGIGSLWDSNFSYTFSWNLINSFHDIGNESIALLRDRLNDPLRSLDANYEKELYQFIHTELEVKELNSKLHAELFEWHRKGLRALSQSNNEDRRLASFYLGELYANCALPDASNKEEGEKKRCKYAIQSYINGMASRSYTTNSMTLDSSATPLTIANSLLKQVSEQTNRDNISQKAVIALSCFCIKSKIACGMLKNLSPDFKKILEDRLKALKHNIENRSSNSEHVVPDLSSSSSSKPTFFTSIETDLKPLIRHLREHNGNTIFDFMEISIVLPQGTNETNSIMSSCTLI
jgi:hypothetical protein